MKKPIDAPSTDERAGGKREGWGYFCSSSMSDVQGMAKPDFLLRRAPDPYAAYLEVRAHGRELFKWHDRTLRGLLLDGLRSEAVFRLLGEVLASEA